MIREDGPDVLVEFDDTLSNDRSCQCGNYNNEFNQRHVAGFFSNNIVYGLARYFKSA